MIGAFYQPRLVLSDTELLNTLPKREFSAGMAEVIKYGLIRDLPFFEWLETNMKKIMAREPKALIHAICESCRNKAEVVAQDEKETGIRAILNLGHTFGHAIETATTYSTWLHGEAVAMGTMLAAKVSQRLGNISQLDFDRVNHLLTEGDLPTAAPKLGVDNYLKLMSSDKKVENERIHLVLLNELGAAYLKADTPYELLTSVLA